MQLFIKFKSHNCRKTLYFPERIEPSMVISTLESSTIKLSVVQRKTMALLVIDVESLSYRVVDCSRKQFCKLYVSKSCPAYCPVIVAAKDFVTRRREPKAEVKVLE